MSDPYATRKTLIMRLQNRYDDSAWEEFAKAYSRYIYDIIRRMGISLHDAEDLVQKIMMRLWNRLPEMDTNELRRFRSYLSTITKNMVLNFIRDYKLKSERENQAATDEAAAYLNSINVADIYIIAEREWKTQLTNMAIEKLEKKYSGDAMTILDYTLQGFSIDDIITKTALSHKQVYNLRTRMKERFTLQINQLRADLE